MGRFITNNFLSPRVAVARLTSVDFVGLVARWLEDERKARAVAAATRCAVLYRARYRAEGGDRRMGRSCRAAWGRGGPRGAACLPRTLDPGAQGAGQTLLDQGLDFVETTLERHKGPSFRSLAQKS
jgi:hypothetical protein